MNNSTNKTKSKNKDRLIARMILGIGLSLTIANGVACGIVHSKFADSKKDYNDASDNKTAYLDTFEQTDEFKTAYNTDVANLNKRLITRQVNGDIFDAELEKLNDNEYTEKVIVDSASIQTKSEFDTINQKYRDAQSAYNSLLLPAMLTTYGTIALPAATVVNYYIFKPKKEEDTQGYNSNNDNEDTLQK